MTTAPEGSARQREAGAPSLAERLHERFGQAVDPGILLEQAAGPGASTGIPSAVLQRIAERPGMNKRYRLEGQLAEGGMGVILRVWDEDLRRPLAMKVVLDDDTPPATPSAPAHTARSQRVGRFLEEALVTAQLDHPGIVPVHELGLDAEGRLYFVMKLVKGEDLKAVFARVHAGEAGWTVTRVLGMLLRACEAMAYAHSKRVIHRDLKPANVMVGRYGEVYIMDWGLARVLDRPDGKDIRVRAPAAAQTLSLRSGRHEPGTETGDSPLITMDGDIVGTPQYMPPEQARGDVERLGPTADVYSLGAMLYHLVSGWMPYVVPGAYASPHAILGRVQAGPPRPLHEIAPQAPAELVAICERAMAREPQDRYADMTAFADDLRAYLERRVVTAYETGAVAELRKWVGRNRALAASLAAVLLLALAAGGLFAWLNVELRRVNAQLDGALSDAERERANVLRLSAFQQLADLRREADTLWPPTPDLLPRYDAWLERAARLVAGLEPSADGAAPGHRQQLAALRQRALPWSEAERDADRRLQPQYAEWEQMRAAIATTEAGLAEHRAKAAGGEASAARQAQLAAIESQLELARGRLAELEAAIDVRRTYRFAHEEDTWWHNQLVLLVAELEALVDPQGGLVAGVSPQAGWGVRRRREFAAGIDELTQGGATARARWAEACAAIADPERCPRYDGLQLAPQPGLLPLGPDPDSGLWEFWHAQSGSEPRRDADGHLLMAPTSGLVLVLLPGGSFRMGAQARNPEAPGYDSEATDEESPVVQVKLAPFFVSKYELTQGQWELATGENPSQYGPGRYGPYINRAGRDWSALLPVEQLSWNEAVRTLGQLGLALPTEEAWEYACRAGTTTRYWSGDEAASLAGVANLSDVYGRTHGNAAWSAWEPWLDDGYSAYAEVGSFRANAFGLHDVHGNVWEWTAERWSSETRRALGMAPAPHDAARPRVFRGGGFDDMARRARCSARDASTADASPPFVGLRPVRAITP